MARVPFKKILYLFLLLLFGCSYSQSYQYTSFPYDPLKARIYTLDNGLKVYMSVNKDEPRFQSYVAVRAGSKNDPAYATGLAHYLEHMLFKGTDRLGTKDFEKEKKYLEKIVELYSQHNRAQSQEVKDQIYKLIDQQSYKASQYAIAGEFDRLSAALGLDEINAYTWVDQTVYYETVPSNQRDNWVKLCAERFRNPQMRLFHTELEAVYEERNRQKDSSYMMQSLKEGLFADHTYGSQTVIGKDEHLKNPRLDYISEHLRKYYIPNNMALCLSGDFDPDEMIKSIDKYFGQLKSRSLPSYQIQKLSPITRPVIKEVYGPEEERVLIGFRSNGQGTMGAELTELIDMILTNGVAGLIDLDLVQDQKVLDAYSYPMIMKEHGALILAGTPRPGQSLEDVKALLLKQVAKIKKGQFPHWLLKATINDLKFRKQKELENNSSRAHEFVDAFINDIDWGDKITHFDRLSSYTKSQIIDYAKQHLNDNYVVVYKRRGQDQSVKIKKPEITPIQTNPDEWSLFSKEILNTQIKPIEPHFISFKDEIDVMKLDNEVVVHLLKNINNDRFKMSFVCSYGILHDKRMAYVFDHIDTLGTDAHAPKEIKQEFYKLGCRLSYDMTHDEARIIVEGLSENFPKIIKLIAYWFDSVQADQKLLNEQVKNIIKSREDSKKNSSRLWGPLVNYCLYGSKALDLVVASEQLKKLKSKDLVSLFQTALGAPMNVYVYSPLNENKLTNILDECLKVRKKKLYTKKEVELFRGEETRQTKIYVVDFDMKQAEVKMISRMDLFNLKQVPIRELFNQYYDGGMGSVIFQQMRETKSLAYSAHGYISTPYTKDHYHYLRSGVGTQVDKLPEAMEEMGQLFDQFYASQELFLTSKKAVESRIRSRRPNKFEVLSRYKSAQLRGYDYDVRKDIFDQIPKMTLKDLEDFFNKEIKGRHFTYLIMGPIKQMDLDGLKKYGELSVIKPDDFLGY